MTEPQYEIDTYTTDGLFIKAVNVARRGSVIPQHSHLYAHTSFIATGAVSVWKDGVFVGDYTAPIGILIAAGAKHKFLTLTDDVTILCLHNLHNAETVKILEEHELTPDDLVEMNGVLV